MLLTASCSGKELPDPPSSDGGGDDSAIDTTDSGAASDDTEVPTDTAPVTDDTSDADTSGPENARLEGGGVITCADPGARAASPLLPWSPGGDWDDQDWEGPETNVAGAGVTVAELTGDGRNDIYLSHWEQDQLYVGQADGSFTDETAARLPAMASNTSTTTAADVDGDGDLDLYVSNMEGNDYLLINDGSGHFSDGTAAAGLAGRDRRSLGNSFGDMDGDGDLDLFVADYLWCQESEFGAIECDRDPETLDPRTLWENRDGVFVDVSERLELDTLRHSLMHGAVWVDVDDDDDQDLYIINDFRTEISWVEPNLLYLNGGDGTFTRAPEEARVEIAIASMGIGLGDINSDERPDFIISDFYRVSLLESLSPVEWYDGALARGLQMNGGADKGDRETGWGTLLEDFDNDGDLDTAVVFGILFPMEGSFGIREQPDALFLQGDDGQFEEIAEQWGFADTSISRALGIIDIDGDGWLDFIRGALDAPATLYRGACGAESWLEIHLRDDATANRYGVGARVKVTAGGESQLRWIVAGGTSIHTSLQPMAHFGLDDAAVVDKLEVRWPDGETTTFSDVTLNQIVTVSRESD